MESKHLFYKKKYLDQKNLLEYKTNFFTDPLKNYFIKEYINKIEECDDNYLEEYKKNIWDFQRKLKYIFLDFVNILKPLYYDKKEKGIYVQTEESFIGLSDNNSKCNFTHWLLNRFNNLKINKKLTNKDMINFINNYKISVKNSLESHERSLQCESGFLMNYSKIKFNSS